MNKPIKRNKNIVKISQEHHGSLLFCWKIRAGLKKEIHPQRLKDYVAYFSREHMLPHFAEEERTLFMPVRDEMVNRALDEHIQILQLVQQVNDLSGNDVLPVLKTLADTVDDHVRYEERELFPYLEEVLTDEQLEQIGKLIQEEFADELEDCYHDEFWKRG